MLLLLFCRTTGPSWKVPGRNPDRVIESNALHARTGPSAERKAANSSAIFERQLPKVKG
jgi:hypothetical protein